MTENDGLRRYIEAGMALTQITRARAEEVVRELIRTGEIERNRAQDWAEDLVRTSRERSEALVAAVRKEVRQQLKELGFTNMDDLARKVADILSKSSAAARKATAGRRGITHPAKKAGKKAAARGPAKKGGTKKAAAKKAAAKKTGGAKAGVKGAGAKKAGAQKAAG